MCICVKPLAVAGGLVFAPKLTLMAQLRSVQGC